MQYDSKTPTINYCLCPSSKRKVCFLCSLHCTSSVVLPSFHLICNNQMQMFGSEKNTEATVLMNAKLIAPLNRGRVFVFFSWTRLLWIPWNMVLFCALDLDQFSFTVLPRLFLCKVQVSFCQFSLHQVISSSFPSSPTWQHVFRLRLNRRKRRRKYVTSYWKWQRSNPLSFSQLLSPVWWYMQREAAPKATKISI